MSSLNKVTLIGHVGQAPEVKTMPSGKKLAKFSVATSERVKDKSGEYVNETQWHKVSVLNDKLAEVVDKYFKKGSKVYVEGQIRYNSYKDKNGDDKVSVEIVIAGFSGQIILLDPKNTSPNNTSVSYEKADSPFDDDSVPF